MNVGLILGGGGVVGIAWEIGVMAGLREHAGFDPLTMSLIVGTSAGSVAGAQVALGHDLDELVARQQRTRRSPRSQKSSPPRAPGAPSVVPNDIMRLMISGDAPMEERTIAIGKLAIDADVALGEAEYVESFRSLLGTDEWPEIDLCVTTAECETGRSILWSKADGIDLLRAVASSCAIPGWFPPVEFAGHRYIDAPRVASTRRSSRRRISTRCCSSARTARFPKDCGTIPRSMRSPAAGSRSSRSPAVRPSPGRR